MSGTTFTDTAGGTDDPIDNGTTLTLKGGATIDGGTINDGTVAGDPIGFAGLIDVTGNSQIDSNASLNNGYVTVESGVTLTLDNVTVNGTTFNDLVTGGTIQIDGGDTLTFNGDTVNGGTLDIFGTLDSTGTSFINGATIVNVSNIVVVSGTLTIDPTPVTNTGTIEVSGDSTLVLSDDIVTNGGGHIQVDAVPSHTATLDLEGSTINGGSIIVSGVLDSTGDSFINGATITNTGTIDVTGGTLIIDATSTFINSGTLETNGGNLIIDTTLSGNLEIKGGAELELGANSPYSAAAVTFDPDATGTLKLDHSQSFGGTVAGLDDNTIDLADISSVRDGLTVLPTVTYSGDSTHGTLTIISNVDHTEAQIQLTGDYTGVTWSATSDGHGGTSVTEVPGVIAGLDPNGNATEGSPIKASITDGGAAVTATYTWQILVGGQWVLGSGVADLNGNYTPGETDEGHALQVSISYVDALGHSESAIVSAGTVSGTADTPVLHASASAGSTTENTATVLSGLSVSTTDGGADNADTFTATVYVEHGKLTLGSGLHATISGGDGNDAADPVVITGSLTDVNAALAAITYTPAAEYEGTDTVHFTATLTEEAGVGGNVSAAATPTTATITVNPVAEAAAAIAPATLTLSENDTSVAITGVSVGPLAEDGDDTVSAALTVGHGMLHVDTTSLPAGVTVTGDNSGALTISGDAAAVNALLKGLTYTPTGEYEGTDTLNLSVTSTDGSNTYPPPATASTAITVNPVAEAPQRACPGDADAERERHQRCDHGRERWSSGGRGDDSVSAALTVGHGTLHGSNTACQSG